MPKVEKMAIEYVSQHLRKERWAVKTRNDNKGKRWIGYDLLATYNR